METTGAHYGISLEEFNRRKMEIKMCKIRFGLAVVVAGTMFLSGCAQEAGVPQVQKLTSFQTFFRKESMLSSLQRFQQR